MSFLEKQTCKILAKITTATLYNAIGNISIFLKDTYLRYLQYKIFKKYHFPNIVKLYVI